MRLCLPIVLLFALATVSAAQDTHSWDSVGRLKPGDQVRLSLRPGSSRTGDFQNWTQEQVTVGGVTDKKQEVLKIERYRPGGWSRGKKAAVGALIGFGGGFAIGAAVGGCEPVTIGPCYSRGTFGAGMGGAGAIAGALVGALLPHHHKELIYAAQ